MPATSPVVTLRATYTTGWRATVRDTLPNARRRFLQMGRGETFSMIKVPASTLNLYDHSQETPDADAQND